MGGLTGGHHRHHTRGPRVCATSTPTPGSRPPSTHPPPQVCPHAGQAEVSATAGAIFAATQRPLGAVQVAPPATAGPPSPTVSDLGPPGAGQWK